MPDKAGHTRQPCSDCTELSVQNFQRQPLLLNNVMLDLFLSSSWPFFIAKKKCISLITVVKCIIKDVLLIITVIIQVIKVVF